MRVRRRIGAYGLCRDDHGRVLLVRASHGSTGHAEWALPGGGVQHGEHPVDAVVREVAEETGLRVEVVDITDILTDVAFSPTSDELLHHDRFLFNVRVVGGELRNEVDGTSDLAAWVSPAELAELPLMGHTARLLGLPSQTDPERSDWRAVTAGIDLGRALAPAPPRHQRFAAYGLVTDLAGRVLLTRIAPGFPGAGCWHLPGGGTDFGESAVDGLRRELVEETNQRGRIDGIWGVSHRHHHHTVGPEQVPIDWHGVRVVFRVLIDEPTRPRVVEGSGGSTAAAAWFTVEQALELPLTEISREMIDRLREVASYPR